MTNLNGSVLNETEKRRLELTQSSPATILQIGEGHFLRGFFDWMIHTCRSQGLFDGSIALTQPRPSGRDKIAKLAAQDGLYTLVIRGMENGRPVERREIVSVFSEVFDPYENWTRLVELAISADLRFVVSNTTEAGLAYQPELLIGEPIASFPGKIAYLLYRRFCAYEGAPDRGLIFLPCELLERNGDALRDAVLRYSSDWGFPPAFVEWVKTNNRFLNSLVDRIVTGYPDAEQAEAWFAEWGFADEMLDTAEPYHLWAIEGEPELDDLLPFRKAGLNVHWTNDLEPYQKRKVHILNGAHTLMATLGLLNGVEHVRQLMEHPTLAAFVREAVESEIVPTLPYPQLEMRTYADSVFERFANPYIRHRLSDIAMNSISKFKVRLVPSMAFYAERGKPIPPRLACGFAGLLRYYRVHQTVDGFEGKSLHGTRYTVRDDSKMLEIMDETWKQAELTGEHLEKTVRRLLADERLWDRNLSEWTGLVEKVSAAMAELEKERFR